jgi:predicted glutamine amidotransferase
MCGIAGLIGESKDPKVTFQLMTRLFEKIEKRGEDSSGFWATQKGKKGAISYHKEPTKSTDFVYKKVWKEMRKFNPNCMLMHARAATPGIGTPNINKNNHPFVSDDVTLSIIHNGKLPEYHFLKDKYETFTNCDSELVLRILQCENELPPGLEDSSTLSQGQKNRLAGIKQLWSLSYHAHMAVAVGEWFDDGTRQLWLWRNQHRPLWVADMRDTLGQIFFFSEDDIWWDAVSECPSVEKYLNQGQKMYEMPTEEIWFFEVNEGAPVVAQDYFQKFNIIKKSVEEKEEDEIDDGVLLENEVVKGAPHRLICGLGEDDEPLEVDDAKKPTHTPDYGTSRHGTSHYGHQTSQSTSDVWRDKQHETNNGKKNESGSLSLADEDENLTTGMQTVHPYYGVVGQADVEQVCEDIKRVLDSIATDTLNQSLEGSLTENEYQELLDSLESTKIDLQATQQILDKSS